MITAGPDDTVSPRSSRVDLVVLAASAGGVHALRTILAALPADFPAAIAVVQHRSTELPYLLPEVLQRVTPLEVRPVSAGGEAILPGRVYLAPPGLHLVVRPGRYFGLMDGRRIRHVLSSANPLLETAAREYEGRVVAVVLTGWGSDATDGVQSVKAGGGVVIAQDRATSEAFGMPHSAIATGAVDLVLPLEEIAPTLVRLATERVPVS